MVTINKLYKTRINCSTYEPQIDSINTRLAVRLIDYNNEGVANQTISVTANKGSFVTDNIQSTIEQEAYINFSDRAINVYVNNIHPNQIVHTKIDITQNGNTVHVTGDLYGSDFVFDSSVNAYVFSAVVPNATSSNTTSSNIGTIQVEHLLVNNVLYLGVNDTYYDISTSKTVTATSNDNGYIYLYYYASDWGFDTIQANNSNITLYTKGWRTIQAKENIDYTINSSFNNNPFPRVIVRYDNNINVAQIILYYKYSQTYTVNHSSAIVLLTFNSNEDNPQSRIPSYIFDSDYPYRVLPRPEGVYYINKNKNFCLRLYNDIYTTQDITLNANVPTPMLYEKMYDYEGD